jgi:hypothetical protein
MRLGNPDNRSLSLGRRPSTVIWNDTLAGLQGHFALHLEIKIPMDKAKSTDHPIDPASGLHVLRACQLPLLHAK